MRKEKFTKLPDDMMHITSVAYELGWSTDRVCAVINKGQLEVTKISGQMYIATSDFLKWSRRYCRNVPLQKRNRKLRRGSYFDIYTGKVAKRGRLEKQMPELLKTYTF